MIDPVLKNAVLRLLRPLVRYLIGRGWGFPAFSEMLKAVYVEEAVRRHAADPQAATDSRVSLLTGVHRKDVKRLREALRQASPATDLRHGAGLAARVVAAWTSAPRYLDARRRPKPLPQRHAPNRLSFEGLVRETRADMRASVILDELVRAGVAEAGKDGKVRLLRSAYVSDVPADKLAYLGDNVGDHLQSALYNIAGQGKPFLERAVYYELMSPEDLDRLRPELVRLSEEFLQAINRKVMPLNREAIRRKEPQGRRIRLGVFYYEDNSRIPVSGRKRQKPKRGKQQ